MGEVVKSQDNRDLRRSTLQNFHKKYGEAVITIKTENRGGREGRPISYHG